MSGMAAEWSAWSWTPGGLSKGCSWTGVGGDACCDCRMEGTGEEQARGAGPERTGVDWLGL